MARHKQSRSMTSDLGHIFGQLMREQVETQDERVSAHALEPEPAAMVLQDEEQFLAPGPQAHG